ncbi:M10 family metallopeptidase C-terminal domain-containing protein [Pseudomonas synxantha]|uniref:M10 family metallopeptidase C-terminal domain-containing protein n=1 Tax=Pseudomonas synxantha TaxID=47883 RepID=UPI002367F7C2|nr:M10 family metallopeptidase C-terminal domain-containing protein [Pseudomonas synxantha]WDG44224.1 M10 family metallopeptidase C-terminal domain-containing protein [Pseudomonas synxantha]
MLNVNLPGLNSYVPTLDAASKPSPAIPSSAYGDSGSVGTSNDSHYGNSPSLSKGSRLLSLAQTAGGLSSLQRQYGSNMNSNSSGLLQAGETPISNRLFLSMGGVDGNVMTANCLPMPKGEEIKPKDQQSKPADEETKAKGEQPRPTGVDAKPKGDQPKPTGMDTKPQGEQPKPTGMDAKPKGDQPKPTGMDTKPQGEQPKPTGMDAKPKGNQPQPNGVDTKPQDEQPKPTGVDTKPKENQPQPTGVDTKPQGDQPKPTGVDAKPKGDQPKPTGVDAKPKGNQPQPTGVDTKPQGEQPKPTGVDTKPKENQPQPTGVDTKPQGEQPKPTGMDTKPQGEQPKPTGMDAKPQGDQPKPTGVDTKPKVESQPPVRPVPKDVPRSDDTTYGFNSTTGKPETTLTSASDKPEFNIWDQKGIDTFDFSGFKQDQIIDLRSGSLSSVGGLRENVRIGTSTMIENAVGGSGNDRIIGNSADNVLIGGAGADCLVGGGGWNTFKFNAFADSTRTQADLLLDFNTGQDKIDLSQMSIDGKVAFNFVEEYTGKTGDTIIKFNPQTGRYLLAIDLDGDGKTDFLIKSTRMISPEDVIGLNIRDAGYL